MKFDCVVGNPPYDRNLHLKIMEGVVGNIKPDGSGCFVHPARWIQDPLWKYKENCDRKRFSGVAGRLESVYFIKTEDMYDLFKITYNGDLMVSVVKSKPTGKSFSIYSAVAQEAVDCVLGYSLEHNIAQVMEKDRRDGWRCQIHRVLPLTFKKTNGMSETNRKRQCNIFSLKNNSVYFDGYTNEGVDWVDTVKNQYQKPHGAPFPYSIRFGNEEEARNFESSCNTNFYNNILFVLKLNATTPFEFLPYMEDYSHPWTDSDYCDFFAKRGMSEECRKWLCRDVYDYRDKDFIDYIEFENEN